MVAVALAEAKARLSELVKLAGTGETVTITNRGKPVARLVAEEAPKKPFSIEELDAIAAHFKPYIDPDGLSFVERMRQEDLL